MNENIHTPAAVTQASTRRPYLPDVDIVETETELVAIVDLPGVQKERIDLRFEGGILTIKATATSRPADDVRYASREYVVGDFERTFEVREPVDAEKLSAQFTDGVLTVSLPKRAAAQRRKIDVN